MTLEQYIQEHDGMINNKKRLIQVAKHSNRIVAIVPCGLDVMELKVSRKEFIESCINELEEEPSNQFDFGQPIYNWNTRTLYIN